MELTEEERRRFQWVWSLAQSDIRYGQMMEQMAVLEPEYESVLSRLSPEQQDVLCDYVSLCEEMSQRMLEVACRVMVFPNARQLRSRMTDEEWERFPKEE